MTLITATPPAPAPANTAEEIKPIAPNPPSSAAMEAIDREAEQNINAEVKSSKFFNEVDFAIQEPIPATALNHTPAQPSMIGLHANSSNHTAISIAERKRAFYNELSIFPPLPSSEINEIIEQQNIAALSSSEINEIMDQKNIAAISSMKKT